MPDRPNLVYVFADQWRADATGYAGDPNVKTPHLDRLAGESINFNTHVANCPVCTPARACLITGQYPLTHGLFVNDVRLPDNGHSIAHELNRAGYDTGWIGKWHLNGHGRSAPVAPEHRQGFAFWRGRECCHDYHHDYWFDDEGTRHDWPGYDADAQTADAIDFINERAGGGTPFALFLSWGPPHNNYFTAPDAFRAMYDPADIVLRDNVPADRAEQARKELAGYYAHCSALDACVGRLLQCLDDADAAADTLFVFASDHGDCLHSHNVQRKQWPFDESVRVPFLLRWPRKFHRKPSTITAPFGTVDIMPTLLSLMDVPIPDTVEGRDFAPFLRGKANPPQREALIACYWPFGECQGRPRVPRHPHRPPHLRPHPRRPVAAVRQRRRPAADRQPRRPPRTRGSATRPRTTPAAPAQGTGRRVPRRRGVSATLRLRGHERPAPARAVCELTRRPA